MYTVNAVYMSCTKYIQSFGCPPLNTIMNRMNIANITIIDPIESIENVGAMLSSLIKIT